MIREPEYSLPIFERIAGIERIAALAWSEQFHRGKLDWLLRFGVEFARNQIQRSAILVRGFPFRGEIERIMNEREIIAASCFATLPIVQRARGSWMQIEGPSVPVLQRGRAVPRLALIPALGPVRIPPVGAHERKQPPVGQLDDCRFFAGRPERAGGNQTLNFFWTCREEADMNLVYFRVLVDIIVLPELDGTAACPMSGTSDQITTAFAQPQRPLPVAPLRRHGRVFVVFPGSIELYLTRRSPRIAVVVRVDAEHLTAMRTGVCRLLIPENVNSPCFANHRLLPAGQ